MPHKQAGNYGVNVTYGVGSGNAPSSQPSMGTAALQHPTRHDPCTLVTRTTTRTRSSNPSCSSNARYDWRRPAVARRAARRGSSRSEARARASIHVPRKVPPRPPVAFGGVQLEHVDPLVAKMHETEPDLVTTSCAVEAGEWEWNHPASERRQRAWVLARQSTSSEARRAV